ncbi:MAG TPA: cellulase family glycosylhydrolase [Acidimicrobiales bacterium]|nr:cellulase family glycosylhydrolase [Acidimicrobiales bacterium]
MPATYLQTRGTAIVGDSGQPIRLRGVGLGGWMNMENFITGYAANESLMRAGVRAVVGDDRYELFFDRLLTSFFGEADARLLADAGLNSVRIPVNYHHFEDDDRPFEIKEGGFRHLDRVLDVCAAAGLYTVIDLHAVPGAQNHHWHSDNPTHVPMLWTHRQFQDRLVHLWEVIADRYKDRTDVAGYNLINEPADESRAVVGPLYSRLVEAVRAIDPHHIFFLDGNTYSTEFDVFAEVWDNTVYTCHDYVPAGLGYGGDYPGYTREVWIDRKAVEQKFLQRSAFCRETGTPIWVGEFGPIYTGDPERDKQRSQILEDQLAIYRSYDAGWAIWTYKDLGMQGVASIRPGSPWDLRFRDFVAKKNRLGADSWGSTGVGEAAVTEPVQEMFAREFPNFAPYPWGMRDWVRTLLLNVMVAQPLASEYAELFRGLSEADLVDLADSWRLENCDIRTSLLAQLSAG